MIIDCPKRWSLMGWNNDHHDKASMIIKRMKRWSWHDYRLSTALRTVCLILWLNFTILGFLASLLPRIFRGKMIMDLLFDGFFMPNHGGYAQSRCFYMLFQNDTNRIVSWPYHVSGMEQWSSVVRCISIFSVFPVNPLRLFQDYACYRPQSLIQSAFSVIYAVIIMLPGGRYYRDFRWIPSLIIFPIFDVVLVVVCRLDLQSESPWSLFQIGPFFLEQWSS